MMSWRLGANPDPLPLSLSPCPRTHTHTLYPFLSQPYPNPTSITMITSAPPLTVESGEVNLYPLPFAGDSKLRRFRRLEIALAETVEA